MDSETSRAGPGHIRRRTFLIDRKFQFKWTLIIVTVGVLISAGLGYFIVRLNFENTELLGLDARYADELAEFDAYALYYLIGFVVVMALFLFIWGIFMTHRVAGPIFIISRYLGQIASGEVPETRPLRRGDELKEFFDTFSSMVEGLRETNLREAELLSRASAALKEKGIEEDTVKALDEIIEKKKIWEKIAP